LSLNRALTLGRSPIIRKADSNAAETPFASAEPMLAGYVRSAKIPCGVEPAFAMVQILNPETAKLITISLHAALTAIW
jgi:hypothetical protein